MAVTEKVHRGALTKGDTAQTAGRQAGKLSLHQKGGWESLRGPEQGGDRVSSQGRNPREGGTASPSLGVCGHQALGRDLSGFPSSSEILLLVLPVGPVFPRPRGEYELNHIPKEQDTSIENSILCAC